MTMTEIKRADGWWGAVRMPVVLVMAMGMVLAMGVAGEVFADGDDSGFSEGMMGNAVIVWGWVKLILQIGLFIWFAVSLAKLVLSRDKQGDWWQLLYLLIGIVALQYALKIYEMFAGDSALSAGGFQP